MNIKSLLLGSAAALVAVSGARAADAVVYEPEAVEYVKVCDAYGAGFYYIPGTETCLSISGYVWLEIGARSNGTTPVSASGQVLGVGRGLAVGAANWSTRARVNFDARSDTEWGTLRSYIRLQADWNAQNQLLTVLNAAPPGGIVGRANLGTDGNVVIDQAFIELGGFRMGYTESAWNQTMKGGVSNWGSHSYTGLSYGYQQRQLIAYSFAGNGFSATLSLEDDGNSNYMPDVVGVVAYNAGWGGVWAKAAYDEDIAPASAAWLGARAAGLSGLDGFAASIGAQINVPNMPGSSLRLIGFYAENANAYSVGSKYSILASYNHVFSSKLSASVAFQYFNDTNYATAGSPDAWQTELSVVYMPVKNFEVRGELNYARADGLTGSTSGYLRFTRYF